MNLLGRIVGLTAWAAIAAAWTLPPKPAPAVMPNLNAEASATEDPAGYESSSPSAKLYAAGAVPGEQMFFPDGIKVTFQPEDYFAYAVLPFPELAPVEFDGPFTGPVALTYAKGEIWTSCGIDKSNYPPDTTLAGCAQRRGSGEAAAGAQCTIYIAPLDILKKHGLTYRIVLRHEISHCRGWPGSHPGAR